MSLGARVALVTAVERGLTVLVVATKVASCVGSGKTDKLVLYHSGCLFNELRSNNLPLQTACFSSLNRAPMP